MSPLAGEAGGPPDIREVVIFGRPTSAAVSAAQTAAPPTPFIHWPFTTGVGTPTPAGPCDPVAPVVPCGPVEPWGPVVPVGPVGPGIPCGPVGPAGPIGPLGPGGPVGPVIVPPGGPVAQVTAVSALAPGGRPALWVGVTGIDRQVPLSTIAPLTRKRPQRVESVFCWRSM